MMRRGLDFGLASSLVAVFALLACFSKPAAATNVSLSGAWSYESTGSTVVLRVDRITNHSTGGHSGTLRLELWAFATPYNGTSQQGYRLASYTLNPLSGGYHYPNLSTGSIAFTRPATGTWHIALLLMEYDGARYVTIDWLLSSAGQVMSCSGGTCTTSTPASSTPGTTTPAAASVSTNRSTYTVNAGESLVLSANLQAGSAAGSLADIYVQVQIEGGDPYYLGPNLEWGPGATPILAGFRLADVAAPSFYSVPLSGVPAGSYQFAINVVRAGTNPSSTTNRIAHGTTTTKLNAAPSLPGSRVVFNPPAVLGPAVVGTPFQFDFYPYASGGSAPYYFTLGTAGGFPPIGLILAPNGVLSGTPSIQSNTSFVVCAVDLGGNQSCTTVTLNAEPRPASGGSLTGTWSGNWTRPVSGLCDYETSALTWTLTQTGSTVTGSYQRRVTAIDSYGICPDPVGATFSGSLVNGVVSGNSLTIYTSGGTRFAGTFDASTITGTGGSSLGSGAFTLNRQ